MIDGKKVCALIVAASFFLASESAFAQDGATLVAIVTADPNGSLTRRVRAELEALGVDVIVLKPPPDAEGSGSRAPIEQAARGVGAAAAVRLMPSTEGKVEVWVADRVTGKTVVRDLDASGTQASDASVAVGTVELLRASLMELHTAEPPHGEVKATPKIDALALPAKKPAPSPPRLGLALSPTVELGVCGLGPSIGARLSFWVRIVGGLGARLMGDSTLSPAHTKTLDGSVSTRAEWFGASLVYDFTPPASTWVPEASLGIAAAHVSTTGEARAPYVSSSAGTWVAAPTIGLGVAWAFTRGIRLRADALAGFALPQAEVHTPREEVGRWGAPFIELSPGLEFLWAP